VGVEFIRFSNNKIYATTNLDNIDKKVESLFGSYDTPNTANSSDIYIKIDFYFILSIKNKITNLSTFSYNHYMYYFLNSKKYDIYYKK
jgi:hypothetical protein